MGALAKHETVEHEQSTARTENAKIALMVIASYYQRHKHDPAFLKRRRAKQNARNAIAPRIRSKEQRKKDTEAMKRANKARRAFVASLKDKPCQDCDTHYPSFVMEYDHRPGSEKASGQTGCVGYLATRASIARILEEIAKCDLICSNCHRVRTHLRRPPRAKREPSSEAKLAFFLTLKDKPCTDCKTRYPHYVLDFDHRPGTVKAGVVGRMWSGPREKLLEEVAKCDLVCANCHRIRTFEVRSAS